MRKCPNCAAAVDSDWQCPACRWRATVDGRVRVAMPDGITIPGFAAEFFDDLDAIEREHFWFAARNELLAWAVGRYFPHARSFLEVGCGTGQVASALAERHPALQVTGSEAFIEGLRIAARKSPRVELVQADVRALPYDSEFDMVGAFDVLEHVTEDAAALRSMATAVRPGGGVLLTVPQHRWLWSPLDDYAGHVRRYSRAELTDAVRGAGLHVLRVTSFVSLLLPAMLASRVLQRGKPVDPTAEFRSSGRVNRIGWAAMAAERALIRAGVSLPAGGSLLLIARR